MKKYDFEEMMFTIGMCIVFMIMMLTITIYGTWIMLSKGYYQGILGAVVGIPGVVIAFGGVIYAAIKRYRYYWVDDDEESDKKA